MEGKKDQSVANKLYEKLLNEKKEYEEKTGTLINMKICIFNNEAIFVEVVSKQYLEAKDEYKSISPTPTSLVILSDGNDNQNVLISPIIEFLLSVPIQKELKGHHYLNNDDKIMGKFALNLLKKYTEDEMIFPINYEKIDFIYIKNLFDEYHINRIIDRIGSGW